MSLKAKSQALVVLTVTLLAVLIASVVGDGMILQRRYIRGAIILLCVAILEISRRWLNQVEPDNQHGDKPSRNAGIWYSLPGCAVLSVLTAYFIMSAGVAFWILLVLACVMFISAIRLVSAERH